MQGLFQKINKGQRRTSIIHNIFAIMVLIRSIIIKPSLLEKNDNHPPTVLRLKRIQALMPRIKRIQASMPRLNRQAS